MHIMYDDVDVSKIPTTAPAVAYYVNGHEGVHSQEEMRFLFPHARLLGISVTGMVAADCYDIEKGDYDPSQVPELFKIAQEHGVWRPCFYAQLSGVMPAVKRELNTVVTSREQVRLWVASYDGVTIIPQGYDAKQFTDQALGRSLDESICASDFFPPIAHPATNEELWWEAKIGIALHGPNRGHWRVQGLPSEDK